ncbi:MAG: peptide chain release factor N(5)-glutamine methyltransferase [Treponema sp.]|jgi:release factor glutamine methyltransferase|nr:peptide chain release factor N(5)-glutamine methyltransferase [Treponema sp.]
MTITETLARGTALLKTRRVENPGLDAALFLAETLGVSREKLFQRGPDPLPEAERRRFFRLIDRRIAGECTAYILGRKEFRGLDFLVNPAVLVPRPDTETLVEAALEKLGAVKKLGVRSEELEVKSPAGPGAPPHHRQPPSPLPTPHSSLTPHPSPLTPHPSLLDLCTGSGAVAIALKNECPEIEVFASDLSPEALETARLNAARLLGTALESAVTFIQSDLFDRIPRRFHIITANPPYVKSGDIDGLSPEVRGEPRLALDGGEDGLDSIRAIVRRAPDHLFPGGVLLLEADPRQMPLIVSLLEHQGFLDIQTYRDLSGAERVIGGRIREESGPEKIWE